MTDFETLHWVGDADGVLRMIDQTLLPTELVEIDCTTVERVWEAIRMLRVRGAPAIGIAAGYGVCVAIQTTSADAPADVVLQGLEKAADYLATSRPTAVNLFWALDRMRAKGQSLVAGGMTDGQEFRAALLAEAREINEEDKQMCRDIGRHGASLLGPDQGILTHCNAGGLATADYGTALAVMYAAQEAGLNPRVYADETRPLLQGARLTTWELMRRGVDVTLICDSMAAQVMREGRIDAVVVGADRITARGDAVNKIGTYSVALAAQAHDIPFYVAAPSSTFDLTLDSGLEVEIEQRDPTEITDGFGRRTAPDDVKVYNPAFDATPAELITAIICERGIIKPVSKETVAAMLG